mmetsp:Transcript_56134/g.89025  ORF Transcript_56134/g.89025 Transcript_56134/m.89025 type:complete len:128 (+) Transcript_56134:67-450(+)|eukprot:CAMPEP_0169139024 /NCGR_PEP_ID=MMETSP1015-20121227/42692_1 /TAXON_ID=342587 /ORGANISM="Karlodinium micrum, Strain CCMP2283" /LENGTH=127 /DNA_ID=CAMNT_0009204589 /DNA_START=49 /DNA_END=432 /DNA_ORIENTATION=+
MALPGAGVDVMGEEVSRVGDVGEIVGADTEGIGALRISWPRTGKTYDLQPTSLSWYRFFKAGQKEEAEVAEEIEEVSGNGIDRTSSSNESGISMLWKIDGHAHSEYKFLLLTIACILVLVGIRIIKD